MSTYKPYKPTFAFGTDEVDVNTIEPTEGDAPTTDVEKPDEGLLERIKMERSLREMSLGDPIGRIRDDLRKKGINPVSTEYVRDATDKSVKAREFFETVGKTMNEEGYIDLTQPVTNVPNFDKRVDQYISSGVAEEVKDASGRRVGIKMMNNSDLSPMIDSAYGNIKVPEAMSDVAQSDYFSELTRNVISQLPVNDKGEIEYNGVPYHWAELYEAFYPVVAERAHETLLGNNKDYYNWAFEQSMGMSYEDWYKGYADKRVSEIEQKIIELRDAVAEETAQIAEGKGREVALSSGTLVPASLLGWASKEGARVEASKQFNDVLESINTFRNNDFKSGFNEGFDWVDALTLGIADLGTSYSQLQLLEKAKRGEPLSNSESKVLELLQLTQEFEGIKQSLGWERNLRSSVGSGLGSTLAMAPGFAFGMTGVSKIGTTVKLLSNVAKNASKKAAVKQVGKNFIHNLGTSYPRGAAVAPLMPSTYTTGLKELQEQYTFNPDGTLKFEPKSKALAFMGGYIDTMNEFASEAFGSTLGEIIGYGARAFGRVTRLNKAVDAVMDPINTGLSKAIDKGLSYLPIEDVAKLAGVRKALRGMIVPNAELDDETKELMRMWGVQDGMVSEATSEVFGDLMSQVMRDMVGAKTDYSDFKDGTYWGTQLLVSALYGGAMNRLASIKEGISDYQQVVDLGAYNKKILDKIESRELRNKVLSVIADGSIEEMAAKLADIEWEKYHPTDKAKVVDYVRNEMMIQTLAGKVEDGGSVDAFVKEAARLSGVTYQGKGGLIMETTVGGRQYYIIDGKPADRSDSSMLICIDKETGERKAILSKTLPEQPVIHTYNEVLQDVYTSHFSVSSEATRISALQSAYGQMEKPTAEVARDMMKQMGITPPAEGEVITMADGRKAKVEQDLENGSYVVRLQGEVPLLFTIPFYSIQSSNPLTAEAQKSIIEGKVGSATNKAADVSAIEVENGDITEETMAQPTQGVTSIEAAEVDAQGAEAVAQTEEQIANDTLDMSNVPTDAEGNIDFDAIDDPVQYAALYEREAGSKAEAAKEVADLRGKTLEAAAKLEEQAKNEITASAKRKKLKEAKKLRERAAFYDKVLPEFEEMEEEYTSVVKNEYSQQVAEPTLRVLDAMAKMLGLKVRFVERVNGGKANAQIHQDGYVDIAFMERNKSIAFLMGHEFTHRMQDLSPEQYAEFKQMVKDFVGEEVWNALVAQTAQAYSKQNVPFTAELIEDEVTADAAGELVESNDAFLKYLEGKKEDKTFLMKVAEFLRDMVTMFNTANDRERERQYLGLLDGVNKLIESAASAEATGNGQRGRFSIIGEQSERRSIIAPTFYSNAEYAVQNIKQEKATPEQWLKMIEKAGGLKAGEDKWLGLSDWLKDSDKKTLTKDEVLQYIAENDIQIEEVAYADVADISREEIYESAEFAELREGLTEYDEDDNPYINRERYDELRSESYDFVDGFSLDYWGEELEVNSPAAAATYLGLTKADKEINETRLDYTTKGLANKREIALVVPTIEPYNQSDEIHFGDAGEGRAVAWIRFGETWAYVKEYADFYEFVEKIKNKYFPARSSYSLNEKDLQVLTPEERTEYERLKNIKGNIPMREARNVRVLVIDEIQSKRHQDGREKGYISDEVLEAQRQYDYLYKKMYKEGLNEEEHNRYHFLGQFIKENYGIVPSAPFEKNWAELAFKRMLRYAAENGYDYVAWTTGDQQAERYNIGNVIERVVSYPVDDNMEIWIHRRANERIHLVADNNGVILNSNSSLADAGTNVSEVLGKDLSQRIYGREGEDATIYAGKGKEYAAKEIATDGLRIGGEGMRGFYDQMLPSFVKKYTKKWGAEVGEVTMPGLEENNTMHAVNVTDSMRESVMQGQPKFSLATDVASILEEYDTEGVKYGSILDIADGIESLIAESTEDITELENILNDFRAAQDDARRWGNRMDSGGEEEFEEALRAYVNKATLGERSDADSHNSSSEGLLSEGSERLSVNPLTPSKDVAKIVNDTEITKRAAIKIINEGGIKSKINTPAQAVSALGKGLHLDKSDSSQSYYGDFFEGDYIVNGKVVHLRVSTHPATPIRMGNAEADHKVSIVIRKNGEHKSDGTPHSGYTEYVYEPSEVAPKDAANAVVKGVKSLLETGEFVDETGKAVRRDYPYTDNRGTTMYSLITPEMDAAYLDAVERGDMETAQKMVMEAAKLAMPNTKVVDEDGNPKVVYHGTPNYFNAFSKEMFGTSTDRGIWGNGFYFSEDSGYAKQYQKRNGIDGRTLSLFLSLKNPLFISLKDGGNEGAMYFHQLNEKYFTDDIFEDAAKVDENMKKAQQQLSDNLIADGYDGVVIEYSHPTIAQEYVAFEPSQIKSADPVTYDGAGNVIPLSERFNPKKEDIRYSMQTPSLLGVHNISLDKLRKVIKMGGLANPSVAVIDVDKQTHDDYGEYSLILPKNMVDARQGKNAGTWAGDAWTPTYPQVVKRMTDDKAISRFYKDINVLPEAIRSRVHLDFDSFMEGRSANALAYWYLFEKGNAPALVYIPSRYSEDITNTVEEATNGSFSMYGLTPDERAKCVDAYIAAKFNGDRAAFEQEMQERINRLTETLETKKSDRVKKWAQDTIDAIKEYGFDYDAVADFIRDVGYDAREKGKVNVDATITAAREQIETNSLNSDYDAWRDNLDERYGIEEYIFDGYTNSGNRRYLPHTVENASKWMKRQGRQGAVATFPSFGTLIAVSIPKMTTLESIRKRKGLLGKSKEEYDAFREKWENVYYELGKKLQPDAKGFEDYGYWRLIESVESKNPREFIKKQYGIELSEEDMAQLNEMLGAIRAEYPARYFETKFERPLQLSDFVAAVVPNDVPMDVYGRLSDANVEIFEYEKGDSNSRAEAMQKASEIKNVRFSIIGEIGAANLDTYGRYGSPMLALEMAREFEAEGKTAREIRLATNWERGKDGKWRYEIMDGVYRHPQDDDITAKEYRLADILDNPDLYKAYPYLKDLKVVYNPNMRARGSYYNGVIELNATRTPEQMNSTLLHEVQHAIQKAEAFAKGGNTGIFTDEEYVEQLMQEIDDLGEEFKNTSNANIIRKAYLIYQVVKRGIQIDRIDKKAAESYRRLAGEVEARNVQKRMEMTEEQRLNTLLSATEDVARDAQRMLFYEAKGGAEDARYSIIHDMTEEDAYQASLLEEAMRMEREATSNGMDITQEIADATGWVHLADGTWKYYGEGKLDITDKSSAERAAFRWLESKKAVKVEQVKKTYAPLIKSAENNEVKAQLQFERDTALAQIEAEYKEIFEDFDNNPDTYVREHQEAESYNANLDMYVGSLTKARKEVERLERNAKKRKLSDEEKMAAMRAVKSAVAKELRDGLGRYTRKYDIQRMMDAVSDARTPYAMLKAIDKAMESLFEIKWRREYARMQMLTKSKISYGVTAIDASSFLNTFVSDHKITAADARKIMNDYWRGTKANGVSVAKYIDDTTRQAMEFISEMAEYAEARARFSDIKATEIIAFTRILREKLENYTMLNDGKLKTTLEDDAVRKAIIDAVDILEMYWKAQELQLSLNDDKHRRDISALEIKAKEITAQLREVNQQIKDLADGKVVVTPSGVKDRDLLRKELQERYNTLLAEREEAYAEMYNAMPDIINLMQNANRAVETLLRTGKINLAIERTKRKEHEKELIDDVLADLASPASTTKHHIDIRKKSLFERIATGIGSTIGAPLGSMEYMLRAIGRYAPMGEGRTYNRFAYAFQKAYDNIYTALEARKKMLDDKCKNLWGENYHEVHKMAESTKVMTLTYPSAINTKDGGWKPVENATDIYVTQAMYILAMWNQAEGRVTLERQGFTDESINAVRDALNRVDTKWIEFMDWVVEEYLPSGRKRYNAVHRDIFGTSMAAVPNYFPIKRAKEKLQKEEDVAKGDADLLPSTVVGAIKERTSNVVPIDLETSFFEALNENTSVMEAWAEMAGLIQDINAILSNGAVKTTMLDINDTLFSDFKKAAQVATLSYIGKTPDIDKKVGTILNRLWAGSKIAFRLNTAFKQLSSALLFAGYSTDPKFQAILLWRYLGGVGKMPVALMNGIIEGASHLTGHSLTNIDIMTNIEWAKANMPSFAKRWNEGVAGNELMARTTSGNTSWKQRAWYVKFDDAVRAVTKFGMKPNAFIDAFTSAAGARAVYDYTYEEMRKEGYSAEEAHTLAIINAEMTVNTTQQSSEGLYLAPMQMDRSVVATTLSTFMNAPYAMFRNTMIGLKEIFRDAKKELAEIERLEFKRAMDVAKKQVEAQVAAAVARGEYSEEEAKKHRNELFDSAKAKIIPLVKDRAYNKYVKAQTKAVVMAFLNGYAGQVAFNLMGKLAEFMFGDDDEEKKKMLYDIAVKSAWEAPVSMMPLGGYVTSWKNGYSTSFFPAIDELSKEITTIVKGLREEDISPEVIYAATTMCMRWGLGLSVDTIVNIALGIENMFEDGMSAEAILKVMNAPERQIRNIVGQRKEGETAQEYNERVMRFYSILDTPIYEDYFYTHGEKAGKRRNEDSPRGMFEKQMRRLKYEEAYRRDVVLRYGGGKQLAEIEETRKAYNKLKTDGYGNMHEGKREVLGDITKEINEGEFALMRTVDKNEELYYSILLQVKNLQERYIELYEQFK